LGASLGPIIRLFCDLELEVWSMLPRHKACKWGWRQVPQRKIECHYQRQEKG
jgi:hypothetical protein